MDIRELYLDNMPVIEVKGVKNLDVRKTFDCGQCFRFDPVENSRHESEYAGVAFGRHVSFASEGSDLYIYNSDVSDFEISHADWRMLTMQHIISLTWRICTARYKLMISHPRYNAPMTPVTIRMTTSKRIVNNMDPKRKDRASTVRLLKRESSSGSKSSNATIGMSPYIQFLMRFFTNNILQLLS